MRWIVVSRGLARWTQIELGADTAFKVGALNRSGLAFTARRSPMELDILHIAAKQIGFCRHCIVR